jgi:hypothetical protein
MILVAVAVLVGVFFAATGRGGEMSYEPADHAPLDLGPVSAADIALLHPPTALWGYNVQVTNEALELVARAMRERDITIAYLQQQVADLAAPPAAAPEAPLPPAPQHAAPEHAAPEHAAPEHAAPEHAAPEHAAPEHAAPEHPRPEDQYEPASLGGQESPAGQEPRVGHAAGEYRGQDDPVDPAAAPAVGEQDR